MDRIIETLPLVEERVEIGTRTVPGDVVSVSTHVETEQHTVETALLREDASVLRRPVNRVVKTAPSIREENGQTIIPVVREELYLEKRLVLVEEIVIDKTRNVETVTTDIELRKMRAEVSREHD